MRKTKCECGWEDPYSEIFKRPPAYCGNCGKPFDPIEFLKDKMQEMLKDEKERMEGYGDVGFGCYAGRVSMLEHWIWYLETFGDQIMGRDIIEQEKQASNR